MNSCERPIQAVMRVAAGLPKNILALTMPTQLITFTRSLTEKQLEVPLSSFPTAAGCTGTRPYAGLSAWPAQSAKGVREQRGREGVEKTQS